MDADTPWIDAVRVARFEDLAVGTQSLELLLLRDGEVLIQAVPASPNDTLHVMQTAVQGIVFKDIGLAWYETRRAAFGDFVRQHGGPVQSEPRWDFEPYSLLFASAL